MKHLLENDFIAHYELTETVPVNVISTTTENFDLKDDTVLVYPAGTGIAKYENPDKRQVNIINYEIFFKSLPQTFQQGKRNCDLIVYTADNQYFLLNELTNTNKEKGKKRTHAIDQMLQVLKEITAIPTIQSFIDKHLVKQCCYFNKKPQSPSNRVNAIDSFGRLKNIPPHGYLTPNPDIEALGFEFWEISGKQTYLLKETPAAAQTNHYAL